MSIANLSKAVYERLLAWKDKHTPKYRPDWDSYFIGLAFVASTRSHDAETQHGCVIADQNHRILGVGYNGFPRGLDKEVETLLPNTRPDKYPFMLHSERNALANCVLRPDNAIAYVTGQPCNDCLEALWQHGVKEVVFAEGYKIRNASNYNSDDMVRQVFLEISGMTVRSVKPDLTFIYNLSSKFQAANAVKLTTIQ